MCWSAARHGHLEVLKWLRENGCPWDWWACKAAAGGGHLEVLEWMGANGFSIDGERTWTKFDEEFNRMMRQGNLEVVKWVRANGLCRREEDMCFEAAKFGQLEILQ
jgi:hypothetical protein